MLNRMSIILQSPNQKKIRRFVTYRCLKTHNQYFIETDSALEALRVARTLHLNENCSQIHLRSTKPKGYNELKKYLFL